MTRAQSHVVGVALLLAASTVAIGTLTLGVGDLVESRAASADADRVADSLAEAIQPRRTTGYRVEHVRFSDGSLRTVARDVRLFRNGTTVRRFETGGLRYESGEQVVAFVGGAIVREHGGSAWLVREPPIAGSAARGRLLVGVSNLGTADTAVSGGGGGAVPVRTNVSHSRDQFAPATVGLAIETRAVSAFERYFQKRGVPTTVTDLDGDGVPSVRARFPGPRRVVVVQHDLGLVIGHG